jgi:hypothetical protein
MSNPFLAARAKNWPSVEAILAEIDRICAEQRYKIASERREADDIDQSGDDLDEAHWIRVVARTREELVDLFGNLWRGPQAKAEPAPPEHPMQPVILDDHGTARFKRNKIVRYLIDQGHERGLGLNDLARMGNAFDQEDWQQLAQLIGYSVSGAADLSYMSDELIARADAAVKVLLRSKAEPAPDLAADLDDEIKF